MSHRDYEVRNKRAKLAVCPTFDIAFRLLKHQQPDGDYSIVGPGYDCTMTRSNGVVYPTSGQFNGRKMPPRCLQEAKEEFDA